VSDCCEPRGDDRTPAGRRAGPIAVTVVMILSWGALARVLIFGR